MPGANLGHAPQFINRAIEIWATATTELPPQVLRIA
jgi:hypothetical protein